MAEGSGSVKSDKNEPKVENVGLQVTDFFSREKSSIDTDHNSFLSDKELNTALFSGRYGNKDAKLCEVIIENQTDLQKLSNDRGFDSKGVTANDMAKLNTSAGAAILAKMEKSVNADERDREKLPELVSIYKGKIDKDGSGGFTKPELSAYIQSSSDRPAAINAAKFVFNHFDELKGLKSNRSTGAYGDVLPGDYDAKSFGDKDLKSLSHALMPQKEFQKLLDAGRSTQIVSGIGEILFGTLVANENKHSDFGRAVGNSRKVSGYLETADIATDKLLLNEYKERQKMIDSWKYFKN